MNSIMQAATASQGPALHERVAAKAYQLWVSEGRLHGRAMKNWLLAEALVRAELTCGGAALGPARPARLITRGVRIQESAVRDRQSS